MTNQSTNTTPDSGANNQPTVNEQLDKILGNLWDTAINIGSGSDWNRNKITEAKAKIQRLTVEAELSELNALIPIDGLRRADSFDNSVFVVKVGGIHDRIAQLEKELEDE